MPGVGGHKNSHEAETARSSGGKGGAVDGVSPTVRATGFVDTRYCRYLSVEEQVVP
jgi:hypothetical protein